MSLTISDIYLAVSGFRALPGTSPNGFDVHLLPPMKGGRLNPEIVICQAQKSHHVSQRLYMFYFQVRELDGIGSIYRAQRYTIC